MLHLMKLVQPHYQSEAGRFLGQLKAERPHLEADQQASRLIHWDKAPQRAEDILEDRRSRLGQPAYVYQSMPVLRSRVTTATPQQPALAAPAAAD